MMRIASLRAARDAVMARATRDPATGCELIGSGAYSPVVVVAGRRRLAHVVVWMAARRRPVPPRRVIARRCGRDGCVARGHLVPVFEPRASERAGRTASGVEHPGAKLSAADVRSIRARHRAGGITNRTLAIEFGVTPSTVGEVVRGHSYRSVA
jgi:hypothetical protein